MSVHKFIVYVKVEERRPLTRAEKRAEARDLLEFCLGYPGDDKSESASAKATSTFVRIEKERR